jgi:hypothetical protein
MKFCLLFVFSLICNGIHAQVNDIYPDTYINFFTNYSIYNPSFFSEAKDLEVYTNYKSRMAPFNSVATLSLTGAIYIKDKQQNNRQLIRGHLYNEREGSYIQQPRAWIDYAYKVKINEDFNASFGISVGLNQFNVSAPSSTANGNSTAPDVSIGTLLSYKKLKLGGTFKQLLNSKIQPLGATLRYKSFFIVHGTYKHRFVNRNELDIHVLMNIYNSKNIHHSTALLYTFYKSVTFGMMYKHIYGISGIIQYTVSLQNFDVLFSIAYQTPISSKSMYVVPAMQLDFGLLK